MKTKQHTYRRRTLSLLLVLPSFVLLLLMTVSTQAQTTPVCERTIKADVVALDQVIMFNRLGAVNPAGMIYALKQDVVAIDSTKGIVAGNVKLRGDKRPRPIVLRLNIGDCLRINFQNLLSATPLSHQDPEDPLSTSSEWSWLALSPRTDRTSAPTRQAWLVRVVRPFTSSPPRVKETTSCTAPVQLPVARVTAGLCPKGYLAASTSNLAVLSGTGRKLPRQI
jgi:hypothetical protein